MKKDKNKQDVNNGNKVIRMMLGYLCIASEAEASLVRKVQILDRFGLQSAEIAKICGASKQSILDARLKGKKRANAKKKI